MKSIEMVTMRVGDLKTDFGNPRKITKKKRDELRESLETFGDFGIFLIDEKDNIIAGNQRASILRELDENTMVECKRLIGYTNAELKAINIKDNTHAGDWDLDELAEWTSAINLEMDFEKSTSEEVEEMKIKDMELIHYEKYDYVIIACRNEVDYFNLVQALGIEGKKVKIAKKRKIKGRAIWYDQIKCRIMPEEE